MNRRSASASAVALVATLCACVAASCAAHPKPALPVASAEALGFSPAGLDRLAPAFQAFVDSGRVSGIYAVVVRHGQIAYERTFGWRDVARREPLGRGHVFRVYSMTKPVIAVGILRLVDQGRLDLDDPVSKYIPSFAGVRVFAGGTADAPILEAPASPITVRQLLNHTSGLAYGLTRGPVDTIFTRAKLYDARRTLEEFTDSLATIPLLFSPGTSWSYSSGLDVAGRVIEVVSGRTLDVFLEEEIFRPLGMRDTGFRIRRGVRGRLTTVYAPDSIGGIRPLEVDGLLAMFEPQARFLWGSGGLLSTPDDYLRFAQMLLNGGALGDVRILRPETVALMTHNTLPPELLPVSYGSLRDRHYGFGLGVAVKEADAAPAGDARDTAAPGDTAVAAARGDIAAAGIRDAVALGDTAAAGVRDAVAPGDTAVAAARDTTARTAAGRDAAREAAARTAAGFAADRPVWPAEPAGIFRWSGYLGTYFWVDPANDLIAMVWTQLSPGSRVPLEATLQRLVYSALRP